MVSLESETIKQFCKITIKDEIVGKVFLYLRLVVPSED